MLILELNMPNSSSLIVFFFIPVEDYNINGKFSTIILLWSDMIHVNGNPTREYKMLPWLSGVHISA